MSEKKTVLILTDDAESTKVLAKEIEAALKECKVSLKAASVFEGTDLLPADTFFVGCEKPNPHSFAYLEEMLKHINLAGRSCGIFSPGNAGAVDYLSQLVTDSEISVKAEPFLSPDTAKIAAWAQTITG